MKTMIHDHADRLVALSMTVASGSAFASFIGDATDVVQFLTAVAALCVAVASARFYWHRGTAEKRKK